MFYLSCARFISINTRKSLTNGVKESYNTVLDDTLGATDTEFEPRKSGSHS